MVSDTLAEKCFATLGRGVEPLAALFEANPELAEEPKFLTLLVKFSFDFDDPDVVEFLARHGADIHSHIDNTYGTPEELIYRAVNDVAPRCVEYLLKNEAKFVFVVDGVTHCHCLINAVIQGSLEIVELLVEHGAEVNATWNGENALKFAIDRDQHEIAEYLRSHGAKTPEELGLAWSEDDEPAGPDSLLSHIEEHIGTPRAMSVIEVVPGDPPITLHVVDLPDEGLRVVVTEGMSSLPMTVPEGGDDFQYAELVLKLRDDWPLDEESVQDPANSWPLGWLRKIARYPHENQTWLGGQHAVISNEEPPEPLGPGTKLTCLMVLASFESYGRWVRPDGKSVVFYDVIPIYTEERDYEAAHGLPALMEKFSEYAISPCLNPKRVNTALL